MTAAHLAGILVACNTKGKQTISLPDSLYQITWKGYDWPYLGQYLCIRPINVNRGSWILWLASPGSHALLWTFWLADRVGRLFIAFLKFKFSWMLCILSGNSDTRTTQELEGAVFKRRKGCGLILLKDRVKFYWFDPPSLDFLSKLPEKMLSSSYSPIFRVKSFLFELTLDALNWLPQLISLSESYWKWKVLVAQSCPTLWDPMDCTPPGSSVHGILLKTFNSFLWLN